jgi:hypothetical protein
VEKRENEHRERERKTERKGILVLSEITKTSGRGGDKEA